MRQKRLFAAVICTLFMGSLALGADALVDRSSYSGNSLKGPWGEVGFRFRTGDDPAIVRALGVIDLNNATPLAGPDGDGLLSEITVTLWEEATSTEVGHSVIPAGIDGQLYDGFRYAPINTAANTDSLTLEPDTNYVIAFNSGAVTDNYLDANVGVTLNPMYVGDQPSSTWEIRYTGTVGAMPTTTAGWGAGRTYGCVNMKPSPAQPSAFDPAPADKATLVTIGADLAWTPAPSVNLVSQTVYFSRTHTDPNLDPIATGDASLNSVANAALPYPLERDRTYYWRVDSVLSDLQDPVTGVTWSFTTEPPIPLITEQPASVVLDGDLGLDATFSVIAYNPLTGNETGLNYQWYRYVDGVSDIALADSDKYAGTTTAQLTVNDVVLADEAPYYCIADNGGATPSSNAWLTIKRLIAHLPLDGNLLDLSGNGHDASWFDASDPGLTPTPTFDAGIDDQALVIEQETQGARLATSEGLDFYPQGITASVWVKTTQNTWSGIVSKQYRVEDEDIVGWVFEGNPNGSAHFRIRLAGLDTNTGVAINDGEWHLLTGTFNAQERTGRLYVDGLLRATDANMNEGEIPTESTPILIGFQNAEGLLPYYGSVDDLRIYNYARNSLEVAGLFYEILPDAEDICLDGEYPAMDLNGDCIVNLLDFAEMAAQWALCNQVPTCIPLP